MYAFLFFVAFSRLLVSLGILGEVAPKDPGFGPKTTHYLSNCAHFPLLA